MINIIIIFINKIHANKNEIIIIASVIFDNLNLSSFHLNKNAKNEIAHGSKNKKYIK